MSKESHLTIKQQVENALTNLGRAIVPNDLDRKAIILSEMINSADKDQQSLMRKKHKILIDQFVRMHEFDKHFLLAESLPTKFAAMSVQMSNDLIKENHCVTTAEKSLVEMIVNAFCRGLHLSRLLSKALGHDSIPVEQNFVNYYNFLSKELDKANRQYLMALSTLQQLKSPPMKVNLKANTAIIAQNQQFNNVTKSNNENNKTK